MKQNVPIKVINIVSSRERALCALYLEEPDRVPYFEYDINAPPASKILSRKALVGYGGQFQEFCLRSLAKGKRDKLVKRMKVDRVELYKKLKYDILPVRPVFGNVMAKQTGTHEWIIRPGWYALWTKFKFNPKSDGVVDIDSSTNKEEFDGLRKYVEYLEQKELEIDPSELEMIEYAVKEVGDKILVMGDLYTYGGAMPVSTSGLQVFLKCLYMQPSIIRRLIKVSTKRAIEFINVLIDIGVEAISGYISIAYTQGSFFSPKHFKKFVLPSLRAHAIACHKRGVPLVMHIDGNIRALEEDLLVKSRIDGYHPVDKAAGMDIGRIKREYGNKICLLGNVDVATLAYGKVKDIIKETRECIKVAAHGGGYVISSSDAIDSFAKVKNILAMIKTAKKYGKYPIPRYVQ